MTVSLVADDAVDAHGRGRLNDDHADDDEVPQTQCAMETRSTGRRGYSIVVFLIRHGSAPGEKLPILA